MMALERGKNRLITINMEHFKVHDGRMFNVAYLDTLTSGQIKDFHIITGAEHVHLAGAIGVEGKAYIDFIRAGSITAAVTTTAIDSHNMNDNRTNVPDVTFGIANTAGSTVASGTVLKSSAIFAGERNQKVGGEGRTGTEWELKENTTYIFRFEDKSASNNEFHVDFEFYEE